MTIPVAILAGGLAKRLKKNTLNKAKALIDIAGKPFISRQLSYLSNQNIKDIVICTAHLWNQIKDYVGDGSTCVGSISLGAFDSSGSVEVLYNFGGGGGGGGGGVKKN